MRGAELAGEGTELRELQEDTKPKERSLGERVNDHINEIDALMKRLENIQGRNKGAAEKVGGDPGAEESEVSEINQNIERVGIQESAVAAAKLTETLRGIQSHAEGDADSAKVSAMINKLIERVEPGEGSGGTKEVDEPGIERAGANDLKSDPAGPDTPPAPTAEAYVADTTTEAKPNPYSDDEPTSDVNWDDDSGEVDAGDKHIASDETETSQPLEADFGEESEDTKIYEDPNLDPVVQKIYEDITARAAKMMQEAQNGQSGAIAQTESRSDPARYSGKMNFLSSRGVWERFAKDYPEKAQAYAEKNEDIAEGMAASAPQSEKPEGTPKIIGGENQSDALQEEGELSDQESESGADELIRELGLEGASLENPVKMHWANEDSDVEVSVVGVYEEPGADGRMYAKVIDAETGTESGVPLDELRVIEEEVDDESGEETETTKLEEPVKQDDESDEAAQAETNAKNRAEQQRATQERQQQMRDRLERRRKEQAERDEVAVQSITMSLEKAASLLEDTKGEADADSEKQNIQKLGPALKILGESFVSKRELATQFLPYARAFAKSMDKSSPDPTAAEVITVQKMLGNREAVADLRLQEAFGKISALDQETDKASGNESAAYLMKYIVKNSEGKLGIISNNEKEFDARPAQTESTKNATASDAERADEKPVVNEKMNSEEPGGEGDDVDEGAADAGIEPDAPQAEGQPEVPGEALQSEDQDAKNPYNDPEVYSDVNWDEDSAEVDVADGEIARSDQTEKTETKADSGE